MRKRSSLALAAAVVGCGGPPEAPRGGAEAAQAAVTTIGAVSLTPAQRAGRTIYETMCWTCHGAAGRGDGPAVKAGSVAAPPSFQSGEYAGASAATLHRRFRPGVEGDDSRHPHMRYVASLLRPERFDEALSYVPTLAYPPEIPGSALAGEASYRFRCVGCHGEGGAGDGTAADFLTMVKPADFRTDTLLAARDWGGVFDRIREGGRAVHGSSMPPWGVALSEPEIWDLVAYLATLQPELLAEPRWKE